MERIQGYIVKMKRLGRHLKEEEAKQLDPFETKEDKKVKVDKSLRYAEAETEKLRMHPPKPHWFKTKGNHEQTNREPKGAQHICCHAYPKHALMQEVSTTCKSTVDISFYKTGESQWVGNAHVAGIPIQ